MSRRSRDRVLAQNVSVTGWPPVPRARRRAHPKPSGGKHRSGLDPEYVRPDGPQLRALVELIGTDTVLVPRSPIVGCGTDRSHHP
jgi:hypothetical protein